MQDRRITRLRKEYLYRKSLIGKDKDAYEKKAKIKEALQKGIAIPKGLQAEAEQILKEIEYEDQKTRDSGDHETDSKFSKVVPTSLSIDSEYAKASYQDPRIMLTTSRSPSSKLMQFAKEMKLLFGTTAIRVNRGNHQIHQLVEACKSNNASDLVIIHETRGRPDGIIISHMPYGPTAYFGLMNVVPRHDIGDDSIGPMSLQNPHLLFHEFSTKLGDRVQTILKHLFPPPKLDSTRVLTFANNNDYISFRYVVCRPKLIFIDRHHVYIKKNGKIELKEVGPRFEMYLYQIKLGTVDMKEAENEWVLRPYMNTAKKRKVL